MKKAQRNAFSLIELSIVILIIGILIAGVTQGSRLVGQMRLSSARALTQSAPVSSIKDLALWLETSGATALSDANNNFDLNDGDAVQNWYDNNPQTISKKNFTPSASNKRPTYKVDGINSLPSLTFARSPTTLYLQNTDGVLANNDTTYTIFTVSKLLAAISGVNYYFIYGQANAGGGGAGSLAGVVYQGSNSSLGFASGGNDYYPFSVSVNTTTVAATTVNGNAIKFYGNSKTATSTTLGLTNSGPTGSMARVGCAPYNETEGVSANISEVIVFDRILKTEEINSILDYLGKKYAIRIN